MSVVQGFMVDGCWSIFGFISKLQCFKSGASTCRNGVVLENLGRLKKKVVEIVDSCSGQKVHRGRSSSSQVAVV